MATNSWNALVADVNGKTSEMNAAISGANGAASTAKTAAETANGKAAEADAAAQTAEAAAAATDAERAKWAGSTASATTVAAGGEATAALSESGGVKVFTFGIPRGADGAQGAKGDTGSVLFMSITPCSRSDCSISCLRRAMSPIVYDGSMSVMTHENPYVSW